MEKKEEERLLAVFAFLPTGCEQCWWLLLQVHAVAAAKVPTCPPYGRHRPASHLPPLPTEPRAGALHLNLSQCPRPPPAQCTGLVSPRQAGGAVLDPSANRPTDHPLHMEACSISTHRFLSISFSLFLISGIHQP
ncbi:uncharacterized [Tachysurus ichikawai]